MNKLGLGNIVAAEMDKIMGSKEHAQMFSKAEKACKCSEECACKGDCSGSCKACGDDKKDEKMSAQSFEDIVVTLISVSDVLDTLGFRKSAIATLEVLDKTYLEAEKLLSQAQTMAEDLAHDDDELGLGDMEMDQDLGDLGELEAMLGESPEDMEDANDARLLDELGLRPLEEDPELSGAYSQNLADKEKELLQHVGGEGFEEEEEEDSDTDIDELLGNSLSATEPAPSEKDISRLPPPPRVPPTEEEMFADKAFVGKVDPGFMYGEMLQDPSVNMGGETSDASTDREMKTVAPGFPDEVKQAFDRLDAWMAKRAHDFGDDDEGPGFTYGPSKSDKIRLPGGDFVNFESLSPEERLEQEMGAGLHEQLDVDPDQLSDEEVFPEFFEEYEDMPGKPVTSDEDFDADDMCADDCAYDADTADEDEKTLSSLIRRTLGPEGPSETAPWLDSRPADESTQEFEDFSDEDYRKYLGDEDFANDGFEDE